MPKKKFELGFMLNRASFALSRYLYNSFSRHGLKGFSPSFLGVLNCLWEKDSQKLSELAEKIGLEPSSMTGLIDRMERAKLVRRKPDPKDRRAWRVELTEKGINIQQRLDAVFEETYEALTKGIPLGEIAVTKRALTRFIKNSGYIKKGNKGKRI